jgi:hypothetical protein
MMSRSPSGRLAGGRPTWRYRAGAGCCARLPMRLTAVAGPLPRYARLLHRLVAAGRAAARALRRGLVVATRPPAAPLVAAALVDLGRRRPARIAEHALRRQQRIILRRGAQRPRCTPADRALLVLLAARVRTWRSALLIVQPDTLPRWQRQLFRPFRRRRSRATAPAHRPPLAPETAALLREMAAANRRWGAERIRGALR